WMMALLISPGQLITEAKNAGMQLPAAIEKMLSTLEPIVERVSPTPPRYRFRFDATGMEVQEIPPTQVVPGAAPMSVAPASSGGSSATALTEQQLEPARMLNELIEWLDENASFGLNMDLLEQREILITPPNWSYIVRAVRGLLGKDPVDQAVRTDYVQAVRR